MEKIDLEANLRSEIGKLVKRVRMQGAIPAVVYGREIQPVPVSVNAKAFLKAMTGSAGTNIIINLKLKDQQGQVRELAVLTSDIQRNPLNDVVIHIDFRNISMTEKIKTRVPVELVGLPIGVKDEGGVLVHNMHEIEVECLPADIPGKFTVDVTHLAINRSLTVAELLVPSGVTILSKPDDPVAMVKPPTKEEVVVAAPAEGEAAVTAEGEAAPAETKEGGEKVAAEKGAEKTADKAAADKKPAEKKPAEKK